MKHVLFILAVVLCPMVAAAEEDALSLPVHLANPWPAAADSEEDSPTVLGYLTKNSELDLGILWTAYDKDLEISNGLGYAFRWGVKVTPNASVTLAYRLAENKNDDVDLPGGGRETVKIHGFLAGVGFRYPLNKEFEFHAGASLGLLQWKTNYPGASDDSGPAFSTEGAVCMKLTEMVRLKAGVSIDMASTEFHQDSSTNTLNMSALLMMEIGD